MAGPLAVAAIARCAVIGNSNCVQRDSFVRQLQSRTDLDVHNFAVGGCPGIVIAHFLARAADAAWDRLVVETCLLDAVWVELGLYSPERVAENLRAIVDHAARAGIAPPILVILPSAFMQARDDRSMEHAYIRFANAHGLPYLNLCDLGLDHTERGLGTDLFKDGFHLKPHAQTLIADILADVLSRPRPPSTGRTAPTPFHLLRPAGIDEAEFVERGSTLVRERFLPVRPDVPVALRMPDGASPADGAALLGLAVNRNATCGVVEIRSDTGECCLFDLRLEPHSSQPALMYLVAPLQRPLEGHAFTLTLLPESRDVVPDQTTWHLSREPAPATLDLAAGVFRARHVAEPAPATWPAAADSLDLRRDTRVAALVAGFIARAGAAAAAAEAELAQTTRREAPAGAGGGPPQTAAANGAFTMTINELIAKVAQQQSVSEARVRKILEATFSEIVAEVTSGEEVALNGFGRFRTAEHPATTRRDADTGEEVAVPAGRRLVFTPARELRDALAGSGSQG